MQEGEAFQWASELQRIRFTICMPKTIDLFHSEPWKGVSEL